MDNYSQTLMPPHTDKLLARLRTFCDQGTSQAEVARQVGVSRQRINDWLAGRVQMTGEQALALSAFLDSMKGR